MPVSGTTARTKHASRSWVRIFMQVVRLDEKLASGFAPQDNAEELPLRSKCQFTQPGRCERPLDMAGQVEDRIRRDRATRLVALLRPGHDHGVEGRLSRGEELLLLPDDGVDATRRAIEVDQGTEDGEQVPAVA